MKGETFDTYEYDYGQKKINPTNKTIKYNMTQKCDTITTKIKR